MMMFLVFTELRTLGNNKQSKVHALYNIIMKRNHKIDYRHFDELSIQPSISNCQLHFHDGNNFQYRYDNAFRIRSTHTRDSKYLDSNNRFF